MAERFDVSRDGTTLAGNGGPVTARRCCCYMRASRTGGDGRR